MNKQKNTSIEQGIRIKQLRKITHLSRRAFAAKHGIPAGSLQNCEDGRYKNGLTQKMAQLLIKAFQSEGVDCQLNWLMYGEGSPPRSRFEKQKVDLSLFNLKSDEVNLLALAQENEKRHKRNATLFEAAANGRSSQVENLIKSGIDIYLQEGTKIKPYQSEHNTPLHLAALNGHIDIVKILLKNGAQVNSKNRKNQTPLHLAVLNGHRDIIKFLILNHADINSIEDEGDTPLAWACYKGQIDIVNDLIGFGANIDIKNKFGNTPLHWAAEEGYTDIVKILIEKGADIEVTNNEGNSPLHSSIQNGHIETVKFLIEVSEQNK